MTDAGPSPDLTPKTRRPRRTNAERTAKTQAALRDATIECLFELGYAGTTTTVVCRRAGVSRGAQLHHFPTKASLVTAALEQLFFKLNEEYRQSLRRVSPEARRGEAAVDLLWQMVSGPTFYAYLELLVASRTDPELRARVRAMSERFSAAIDETYLDLFPESKRATGRSFAPRFAFAVLEGLALSEITHPGDDGAKETLALLKSLAGGLETLSDDAPPD